MKELKEIKVQIRPQESQQQVFLNSNLVVNSNGMVEPFLHFFYKLKKKGDVYGCECVSDYQYTDLF